MERPCEEDREELEGKDWRRGHGGYSQFIMFLHYPPTSIGEMESGFTKMAKEYGAEQVVYSHCHGEARYQDSFLGEVDGIEYKLVSSDYLRFRPEKILR